MSTDDFAERARIWDQNPERLATARAFLETARSLAPEPLRGRVLDFGAGTGLIGLPLAAGAERVDLADVSPGMLQALRAKIAEQGLANATAHLGELEELALPAGDYDAVVTNNALHHVSDVPRLLARLAGLLAPGGALFLADVALEDGSFHAPSVVPHNGFRPEHMAAMLEAAGLGVLATRQHHSIRKPCHDGAVRDFPQFFILAERRG